MVDVIVYSTPSCPWCHRLKDYLQEKNIAYTDYDVSADHEKAEEMINKTGQRGVPVIEINGEVLIGFDKERIDSLLGL